MTPREIAQKAIDMMGTQVSGDIVTDEVFLTIQNNRWPMQDYLLAVEEKGRDTVNQNIGKAVAEICGLSDSGRRNHDPRSTLIQSHAILE